jgi:UDP-2,4-diacetamido-2,4,6-trideoxy-beta-L-altropyranose hydrolase
MNIVFRTDASLEIGTGHVMRCLTLAAALRDQGANCLFLCREHPGNLIELIRERGFEAISLNLMSFTESNSIQAVETEDLILANAKWLGTDWNADATQTKNAIGDIEVDWLIVDHYAIDARWEAMLKQQVKNLMVIDDLADRLHKCDLLLDQNLGRNEADYVDFVPRDCKLLIGPKYALLRPEFAQERDYSLNRRSNQFQVKRLLVALGGVDVDNASGKVLKALPDCGLPVDCRITVVLGPHAPWLNQVRDQAQRMPWATEVLVNVDNMAKLMADNDLAIGAAGGSTWERCCVGIPTLVIVSALNQSSSASALSYGGYSIAIPNVNEIESNLKTALQAIMSPGNMTRHSQKGSQLVDGYGVQRVTDSIIPITIERFTARLALADDEDLLFEWANDGPTRANSFSSEGISRETHHSWFDSKRDQPSHCLIYIVENSKERAVGQVRFEKNKEDSWEVNFSIAPIFRGRALGKSLLKTALAAFSRQQVDATIIARVKFGNLPSARIFDAIAFKKVHDPISETIIYQSSSAFYLLPNYRHCNASRKK